MNEDKCKQCGKPATHVINIVGENRVILLCTQCAVDGISPWPLKINPIPSDINDAISFLGTPPSNNVFSEFAREVRKMVEDKMGIPPKHHNCRSSTHCKCGNRLLLPESMRSGRCKECRDKEILSSHWKIQSPDERTQLELMGQLVSAWADPDSPSFLESCIGRDPREHSNNYHIKRPGSPAADQTFTEWKENKND